MKGAVYMKRFSKVLLALALVLSMLCVAGCSEVKEAQKSVEGMLNTLKSGDYIGALPYISRMEGDNDFLATGGKFTEKDFAAYDMHKALFESIEYKVLGTKSENPATAVVELEITVLNLEPVAERLFKATNEYNFMAENNETDFTDEELGKILTQQMMDISKDYIKSGKTKTKTYTVNVNVCYEKDRVWRVYPDEKLIDALTGGVYTKYDELLKEYLGQEK
jgi:hypothetical protein